MLNDGFIWQSDHMSKIKLRRSGFVNGCWIVADQWNNGTKSPALLVMSQGGTIFSSILIVLEYRVHFR